MRTGVEEGCTDHNEAFFNVLACAIQAGPEKAAGEKGVVAERVRHAATLLAKFG
jgi:hypothetical protein